MALHIERKHPGITLDADFENSYRVSKEERVRLGAEVGVVSGGKRKKSETVADVIGKGKRARKN